MATSEAPAAGANSKRLPHIVIIGGGFAGVAAVRALKKCEAEITLIDRRNHHIFQPLLYQVATSVLSPAEVAAPIRQLAAQERNLSVMMAEVIKIDPKAKTIDAQTPEGVRTMPFDYLVMAAGVHSSYFGHDEFAPYAPSLKTISNAEAIRGKILNAYERAEWTDDPEERARLMRFVLVGAGPTGVELAASIAQMATVTLRSNFRRIDPAKTSIILVEAGPRTLPTFAESLSTAAAKRLEKLGVQIMVGAKVERVDEQGVIVGGKRIASGTVLWTAGVTASPLVKMLGVATDRAGRASVTPYLNLPDDPDIFVVGDAASVMQNGKPVPGVAQAAIQQGRYVGTLIAASLIGGEAPRPFSYFDRGNMAVVGKNFAVLERGSIRLSGALIWLLWAMIHVMFLPQLQNRLRVQTQWLWSYFTGQRSSRLIPETPNSAAGETAKTEELGSTPAISIQPQPLARTA